MEGWREGGKEKWRNLVQRDFVQRKEQTIIITVTCVHMYIYRDKTE